MARLGALTIGQSPRTDVIPDLRTVLGHDVEIVEAGALDDLSPDEIARLAPDHTDTVLVTRLRDGGSVRVAHRHVVPLLHRQIDALASSVEAILLLCTGTFEPFTASRPVVYPERLMVAVAAALAPRHVGVITPDARQIDDQLRRWKQVAPRITAVAASPYDAAATLPALAAGLANEGADLIVLESLGYSLAMKAAVRSAARRPVLLPRTILARAAAELLA